MRRSAALLLVCGFVGGVPLAYGGGSGAQAVAGAQLFQSSGCVHCHGETLGGTEDGPSLRAVGKQLKPEAIAGQIAHGGQAMPPFGDILTKDQVAELVAYLRKQRAKISKTKVAHVGEAPAT